MKVYQLRLVDFNLVLEPVFKTKEGANILKNKYINRNIKIEESILDNTLDDDFIYRILVSDEEGVYLFDNIFSEVTSAEEYLNKSNIVNASIVREYFSSEKTINYDLEVI